VSSILASRAELLAALEAGGIRTATGGRLTAPCVLVEPGDPWSAPVRMPGRNGQWRLTLLAGKSDTEAAYAVLGEMIDLVDAAIRGLYGVQLPTWSRPLDLEFGGTVYAATIATVAYVSS
jgi:hypothetical protein